jgi:hypothetical protein
VAALSSDDAINSIRGDSLRVRPPSDVVFLCGGVLTASDPPAFLRDVFYRLSIAAPPPYKVILAEEANPLTADAGYEDLLRFEADIAQVVGLIVLFVESAGSLAELGAFAALPEVAPSLLAILNDYYYARSSFVRNGPVKYLENNYGEEWIVSLDTTDLGIATDGALNSLNEIKFYESLTPIITSRLDKRRIAEI